jgi:hypothetical protein
VRPDAEVDEGVLVLDRVAGHLALAFRLLLDQLHLERFAALGEERLGVLARPQLALVDEILPGQLAHLVLDRLEILGHERARHDEVVEEPFVGRRTDAALHAREEVRDRGGEQVRGAVAVERERLGVVLGDDLHRRVPVERVRQVDQPAIDEARQRGLRQTRRDLLRDVTHQRAGRDGSLRSVGQRDSDLAHGRS